MLPPFTNVNGVGLGNKGDGYCLERESEGVGLVRLGQVRCFCSAKITTADKTITAVMAAMA